MPLLTTEPPFTQIARLAPVRCGVVDRYGAVA
jgi:hypothetical protein